MLDMSTLTRSLWASDRAIYVDGRRGGFEGLYNCGEAQSILLGIAVLLLDNLSLRIPLVQSTSRGGFVYSKSVHRTYTVVTTGRSRLEWVHGYIYPFKLPIRGHQDPGADFDRIT